VEKMVNPLFFFINVLLLQQSLSLQSSGSIKNGLFKRNLSLNAATLIPEIEKAPKVSLQLLPCNDLLDKRIVKLALPAVVNFMILPLVGAVDTYWVGRMGNALSLAGQGAANQVFSSSFWIISFLPSVVTPLVAKAYASGDMEAVREKVGEALFLGTILGLIGMGLLSVLPNYALASVLPPGSPARVYAGTISSLVNPLSYI
jgi:Na+-driven multidrug efflux pump